MKSIILILALFGIILIASGYIKSNLQCPPQKIEYRYISKTFEDEQDVQKPILSINSIYNMFENDSPWMVDNSYASANIKYKY